MLYIFHFSYYFILISSIFIIVGHNYPIWLNFKGGRGLAAAAGIFIVLNFGFLMTWLLVWGLFFKFKKDILMANLIATLSLPFLVVFLKKFYVGLTNPYNYHDYYNLFILFTIIISIFIIVKHKMVLSRIIPFTAKNF
jgi:glycerol-3-phosphate acyltransferase PlsY